MLLAQPQHAQHIDPYLDKEGAYTQMDWYAMYPTMYMGDARPATAEKGKAMLVDEFNRAKRQPRVPVSWRK